MPEAKADSIVEKAKPSHKTEAAPVEPSKITEHIADLGQDFSRLELRLIASGGNLLNISEQLKKEPLDKLSKGEELTDTDKFDLAQAFDLRIAHLNTRLNELAFSQPRNQAEMQRVHIELTALMEERHEGKLEISDEVGINLSPQFETIDELGRQLKVPPHKPHHTITALYRDFQGAIGNKKHREDLFGRLKTLNLKEDHLQDIKKQVDHSAKVEVQKKWGKRGLMIGGGVGLLVLLSGWLAAKQEASQKQRQ